MPTLHLLGTGAAVSAPHRTTTMLAVEDGPEVHVVDCGGDVVQRMLASGLYADDLRALYLTHAHPDHIAGFPLFLEKVWLMGRRAPIPIYGPAHALDAARRLFEVFETDSWDGLPECVWYPIEMAPNTVVLTTGRFQVTATPTVHPLPTVALRFDARRTDTALTYSCDTAPSDHVCTLATGSDLLVHEANGFTPDVHSSAQQAAACAVKANAKQLVLVHLPPEVTDETMNEARSVFAATELGDEGGRYEF
ncbi:MAG: MBL fold metallo-hydrolase [Bacteroidota bacterium]